MCEEVAWKEISTPGPGLESIPSRNHGQVEKYPAMGWCWVWRAKLPGLDRVGDGQDWDGGKIPTCARELTAGAARQGPGFKNFFIWLLKSAPG